MDRRSFFKVVGALAATVALPSAATTLLEATQPVPAGLAQLGLIRELAAYDLHRDQVLVRYDVFARNVQTQLGVDMRFTSRDWANPELMKGHRDLARQVLEDSMRHQGISWADLEPLPIPVSYRPLDPSSIWVC